MGKYDDIIDLPHPVSRRHPPMPIPARAAQFLSFAALNGYEDAVAETARRTDRRIELTDEEQAELNEKLLFAAARLPVPIAATYFIPDGRKAGGSYAMIQGRMKKLREFEREILVELPSGADVAVPIAELLALDFPPDES